MKITYCVDGLIEWHVMIKAGRVEIPISFTGGHLSGYGVSPAEFTTADPVLQHAVEDCSYFKSGRIRILRKYPDDNSSAPAEEYPPAVSPPAVIDVPDLASARLQLSRLTDIPPSRLRTRPDIEAAAEKHGIKLIIKP
ncbi:MAG: hypothetical protein K2N03_04240 [Muribaculaceae bacterium]|nr:hypothetical protein [Muribaculaceae bacterium]